MKERIRAAFPPLGCLNIACALTLCGGLCGVGGIFSLFRAIHLSRYAVFQCSAYVCDAMDGTVARRFSLTSPFGKALDSLCDCISFSVLPAVAFAFFGGFRPIWMLVGLLFAACGVLRLAYFDITECDGYFVGLSSPVASGLLILPRFLAALATGGFMSPWMAFLYPLYGLLVAGLMISNLRVKKYGPFNLAVSALGFLTLAACLALGRCPVV